MAHLLDEVEAVLRRYLILPEEHQYPVVALWAAHTYGFERWDSTPRIVFVAPEKDSGKSRALELLADLCQQARIIGGKDGISLAGIRQFINGVEVPTVLVDEFDTIFGRGRSNEDLRGFINSGYRKKTGVVVRAGSKEKGPQFYSTFAPVAMAGISAGALPSTVTSRSFMIRMRRALDTEHVADFDDADPALCAGLAEGLKTWVTGLVETGRLNGPTRMPEALRNRNRQIWRPLLALAEAAGPDWSRRAEEACLAFVEDARRRDKPALGTQILGVIRQMFAEAHAAGDPHADFLPTQQIVERLAEEYTITQTVSNKRLGVELAEYDITPTQRRYQGVAKRGYERGAFTQAWLHYLPPLDTAPVGVGQADRVDAGAR